MIATTATNMLECRKGANFSIVCNYFYWLKQQKLTKLHKAVHIFILTFQTSSIILTKSGLSLNNKENLCGEHVKL